MNDHDTDPRPYLHGVCGTCGHELSITLMQSVVAVECSGGCAAKYIRRSVDKKRSLPFVAWLTATVAR